MMVPVVTVVVPLRTAIEVILRRQGPREQKCASVRRDEAPSHLCPAASAVRTFFRFLREVQGRRLGLRLGGLEVAV